MEQRRTLSGALKRKLKKEKETRETAALQNVPRISQFFKNNIQSTVEAQESCFKFFYLWLKAVHSKFVKIAKNCINYI